MGSSPYEFLDTLSKIVEIGYYEPLGTWCIKLGKFGEVDATPKIRMDEWNVRSYSTSLLLTLPDGSDIGRATLEFTAPFVKLLTCI